MTLGEGAAPAAPVRSRRTRTRYRLENLSRLDDQRVDELVRFAFAEVPAIDRLVAVRVADGANPSGAAYRGASRPRWAGRATWAMRATVVADGHPRLGRSRVCWHSSLQRRYHRGRYFEIRAARPDLDADAANELAVAATYAWVEELAAAGETRVGRFPIYRVDDPEEALLHVLAHEAMHVLQYDRERRGRGATSEVLVEEAAARALLAYRDLTSGRVGV
jgi:hypothetical protein